MDITVSLLYGSVRSDRQGIKAARYLENQLEKRGVGVHFIDPLTYQFPLLDKMYKEYAAGEAPHPLGEVADMLKESDAFLVVTGEYNHSIPPALKNMLDHYQSEYFFKPSAIASYSAGTFGGVRAAVHLRVILGELGMPSISSILPFPVIGDLFNEGVDKAPDRIAKSTSRFLDELIWYATAFKRQRSEGTPY